MSTLRQTEGTTPKAVVLGVQLQGVADEAFEASLTELERLADTLGLTCVGRVTQRRTTLDTAVVIGAGKLKELAAWTGGKGVIEPYAKPGSKPRGQEEAAETVASTDDGSAEPEHKASVVLVDHDLTPMQASNLEKATGAQVLDRSLVILSIFQRHARTREAKLQVEIAQLAYSAPRLRAVGASQDRQRGGVGGKGAGETALELDKRRVRDRIAELKQELVLVQREADTRRSKRSDGESPTVALVGYTNAGKSSLMRALTGDEVYVADQLFATLDTTVRVLKPETRPRILVSDTVGFIKKLPHDLVASFRSTLQEAKEAALLLHLVDASDPALREQLRVTREVLADIGAGDRPTLLVLNKADRVDEAQRAELAAEFPDAVIMSSRSPQDVSALYQRIVETFEQSMDEREFVIGYGAQKHVALLHSRCRVLEERYAEDGTHVRVRAPKAVLNAVAREIEASAS